MTSLEDFNKASEVAQWLFDHGMSAGYITPVYKAYKVAHPTESIGYRWHGSMMYPFTAVGGKKQALQAAIRWASYEFDIASWSKIMGVPSIADSYFATPSLEFMKNTFPEMRIQQRFNTEAYRRRGEVEFD